MRCLLFSFALVAAAALAGCAASGPAALTPEDFAARLPELEARAARAPGDGEAHRDLGEALAQTGATLRAHDALRRAVDLRPTDPKALFYLGLVKEELGQRRAALDLYDRWADTSERSPFRERMAGRRAWLLRELVREEMAALVASIDSVTAGEVTPAVSVLPLAYRGGNPQYAPIGRGLSEMLSVDLATVGRVRVVERVRLQALLAELALAQGEAFDVATAPRLGRLLRSGRIVGGSLTVQDGAGDEALQTDVGLWEWQVQPAPDLVARTASLDDLFRLEKEIAFGLFDALGIRLTPAERDRIERVPTRNLQAFLAYSRGLQEEDAGRWPAAAQLYQQAASLDPGFAEAAQRAEAATQTAGAAGGTATVLTSARSISSASGSGLGAPDLVGLRLQTLGDAIGTRATPTDEARQPTAETPPAGAARLPDPPPPPPRGGNN